MIKFSCPKCGRSITVGDDAAGKTGRCTDCGARVTVPHRVEVLLPAERSAAVLVGRGDGETSPLRLVVQHLRDLGAALDVDQDGEIVSFALNPAIIDDSLLHEIALLSSLKSLNLSDSNVTDDGLAYLNKCSRLKWLFLDYTRITDEGLATLSTIESLEILNLMNVFVTDVGISHLAKLTNLSSLMLSFTLVTPVGITRLKRSLPHCFVHDTCFLGANSHPQPHDRPSTPEIASRQIMTAEITPPIREQYAAIAELRALGSEFTVTIEPNGDITGLTLEASPSVDDDLCHLSRLTRLHKLILRNVPLTDAGLVWISDLRSLKTLCIDGTQISDAGLRHISTLEDLVFLNLTNTHVSDACVMHLQSLRSLTNVCVSNTKLTERGMTMLKRLLPRVEVGI